MRISESLLRGLIREELLSEARRPAVETFLRFGDPRAVKGGVSVIHDPHAYAYAEEPALYGHDAEGTRNLRSEAGISAYPVVEIAGDTIIFRVGNGIGPFSRQLGNFLLDRLMDDDVWIFKARRVPSMALGTDDEPLIDGSTIKSARQVPTTRLRVTERSPGQSERLLDLLDPWDLNGYLDMGYNEFFKTRDVTREQITEFLANLASRFSIPKQLRVIADTEEAWLGGWDEDHGRGMVRELRQISGVVK